MVRRLLTGASKATFNALYRLTRARDRADEVVFLSRRIDTPSYDYSQLAEEFERRGWKVTMHLQKVIGAAHLIPYAFHVLKEIRLLGRCKIAVLDRYDPVVSLLDFECEDGGFQGGAARDEASMDPAPDASPARVVRNLDFPKRPVILQMWHAFGAYKKFGFQSVGTPEGHSASFTDAFNIHRNYSWVMCSGAGARGAFAEAFSCPVERVVALDRPEYDEIAELAAQRAGAERADGPLRVLMAPTLRINENSAHPFKDLYQARSDFEARVDAEVIWSFHPLDEGLPAPGNVSEKLLSCDCVVTDYSSIVYEAYLLGIPVVFYVPDIESYRVSPGLNVDPMLVASELCVQSADDLARSINGLADDPASYRAEALERFAGAAFEVDGGRQSGTAASRIADFVIANL